MSFDINTVIPALNAANGDVNKAIDYCLSGIPDSVIKSLKAAKLKKIKQEKKALLAEANRPPLQEQKSISP